MQKSPLFSDNGHSFSVIRNAFSIIGKSAEFSIMEKNYPITENEFAFARNGLCMPMCP